MLGNLKRKIEKKLSGSGFLFLIAGLFGISSFACPCPFCYAGAAGSFIAGLANRKPARLLALRAKNPRNALHFSVAGIAQKLGLKP